MAAQRNLCGTEKEKAFYAAFGVPIRIKADILVDMFGRYLNPKTGKEEVEYNPDDLITVTENEYPGVNPTTTTVGIYVANKVIVEDLKIFGYINKTFNGKLIGDLTDKVAEALVADDITTEQVAHYIDAMQWLFGGKLGHVIGTSASETIMTIPPEAKKLREKLLKENEKAINEDNDPYVAAGIEKAVVNKSLEYMRAKDDPAMDLFDSGCGVDPYNNYKVMFVMKGPIGDNTGLYPSGYKVATGNYSDGLSADDQVKAGDNLVTSSYASGVETQKGGYTGKKFNATMQNIRLGPRGSDCKTKYTEKVLITEENANEWGQYHFYMEKDTPVMLTPKTIKGYIGKTLKMRVPNGCTYSQTCYCNICFGDRAYRTDITNIGLTMNTAAGAIMNASLKTKHDSSIKIYDITVEDLLEHAN